MSAIIQAKGDVFGPIGVTDGDLAIYNGTTGKILTNLAQSGLPFPRGHLFGLTLSNSAADSVNDIDIDVGECRDITNAANLVLNAVLTKRLDAPWAVGTNQGGLDTGTIANTTYHVFLIKRSDTGVIDALFSASPSPTMPANYTYKRRIGSIMRVAATIKSFYQRGDDFTWMTPIDDFNGAPLGTTTLLITHTVPTGIEVLARAQYSGWKTPASGNSTWISSLDQPDLPPGNNGPFTFQLGIGSVSAGTYGGSFQLTKTNTLGQVRARSSNTLQNFYASIHGWNDRRGRDD